MADDRLTLAVPVDVARQFDSTVSQAQIQASTFQSSPDDDDLLASFIEDAEREFYQSVDTQLTIGRAGVEGRRETFEQLSYKIGGHNTFKRNFTGVWSDYDYDEKTIPLKNNRVVPFDSAEGDQLYIYTGLNDGSGTPWEDVTDDKGELWDIIDNRGGTFVFDPEYYYEAIIGTRQGLESIAPTLQNRVRFQITYRYGGLGGSRSTTTRTELTASLDDSETSTVGVADGSTFPTGGGSGSIVVLIGREYLSVDPDPQNDQMQIVERGVRGTEATAHSSGDRVQYTPPSIRKAVSARAGMQLVSSGRYSEWLPDTEDSLDKSDVLDTLSETWEMTVNALSEG